MALEAARFQMSNDDAGYDKGLQDGWSEAIRSSGGRADVPMATSGTSGPEYRKGLLKGFMARSSETPKFSSRAIETAPFPGLWAAVHLSHTVVQLPFV